MPRQAPRPKTIAERGGLKKYLDDTASIHNSLRYDDFIKRIDPQRKYQIPRTVIAEDFNVSSKTIYKWIHIHQAEQATSAVQAG